MMLAFVTTLLLWNVPQWTHVAIVDPTQEPTPLAVDCRGGFPHVFGIEVWRCRPSLWRGPNLWRSAEKEPKP